MDYSSINITTEDLDMSTEYKVEMCKNYPEIDIALHTLSVSFPEAAEHVQKRVLSTYEKHYIQLRDAEGWRCQKFNEFQQLYVSIAYLEANLKYIGYSVDFLLGLQDILQRIEVRSYAVSNALERFKMGKDLVEFTDYLIEYSQQILNLANIEN